jgi:hypothetical protein
MPPEWNTRSIVEVPELFVSGLLHESDWPTLLGSTPFSRATLSNIIWLSEGARPWPKFPANGMTWACAAAGRRTHTASAAEKQCSDQGRMHLSFTSSAPLRPASTGLCAKRPPQRGSVVMVQLKPQLFFYHLLTGRTAIGCSRVS